MTDPAKQAMSRLGVRATKLLMDGEIDPAFQFKGATRVWSGTRKGQGNNDLDSVFKLNGKLIVVEAKAGDSPLKVSTLRYLGQQKPQYAGKVAAQVSKSYLLDKAIAMQKFGSEKARQIGRDVETELGKPSPNIVYAYVHVGTTRLGNGQASLGTQITYASLPSKGSSRKAVRCDENQTSPDRRKSRCEGKIRLLSGQFTGGHRIHQHLPRQPVPCRKERHGFAVL